MEKRFNHTCKTEKVFKKYYIEETDGKKYIYPDTASEIKEISPFEDALKMVLEYLNIGYLAENGYATEDKVLGFVSEYGFPKRNSKRCSIDELTEDMQVLYLHFSEISASEYPDEPEWILETEPMAAVIRREGENVYTEWQTKNLAAAIETAYTLLICDEHRYIGLCKHCGKPYQVKNPKSEFCSAPCRNRFNVYKSRAKK